MRSVRFIDLVLLSASIATEFAAATGSKPVSGPPERDAAVAISAPLTQVEEERIRRPPSRFFRTIRLDQIKRV